MNILPGAILAASIIAMTSCGDKPAEQGDPVSADSVTTEAGPASASLSELQWLNGWWQKATPEGIVFEEWHMSGDAMAGRSGFIKGKDTMISETISLESKGGDIYYIPTVKGQNNDQPVPFRFTGAAADSFIFENPEHDFPSKIVYKKLSATSLVATISGKIQGKEQAESFDLSKVQ